MENDINKQYSTDAGNANTCELDCFLSAFQGIAKRFKEMWNLDCLLTSSDGYIVMPEEYAVQERQNDDSHTLREQAIIESLRWGEPSLLLDAKDKAVFAVPVTCNAVVVGGLVVENITMEASADIQLIHSPQEIRQASLALLELAENANLTNSSLIYLNKIQTKHESKRAEAIHELKGINYQSIRSLYLTQEPELIASIKKGERAKAREILNRILVGIYHFARNRPSLLKSFILELVVTMSRSAVEAGGDPSTLLGANYSSVSKLAAINSEENLCAWLVTMLERMQDAIEYNREYPNSALLDAAISYMREHIHEDISRDEVADVACLSPSHFSRVIKQMIGYSFTEILAQMRVDRAKELLVSTNSSLLQIALDCGFSDQSYFTKVFQKYTGSTPGDYRKSRASQ